MNGDLILMNRIRRGFTLVELMVVMAIIALLLALALPRYFNHLETSRETILKQDLAVMRDAIDKYHGDRDRYPDSLGELVECALFAQPAGGPHYRPGGYLGRR